MVPHIEMILPPCKCCVRRKCVRHIIEPTQEAKNSKATLCVPLPENLVTTADLSDQILKTCPPCLMVLGFRCRYTPPTPRWDRDHLTLWVGDFKAIDFAREAHSEIAVVEIFDGENWRSPLKDPFGEGAVRAGWLRNAISHLNEQQKERRLWMVWFRRRVVRREITWEYKIPLSET